jgi:hypothetical protein
VESDVKLGKRPIESRFGRKRSGTKIRRVAAPKFFVHFTARSLGSIDVSPDPTALDMISRGGIDSSSKFKTTDDDLSPAKPGYK